MGLTAAEMGRETVAGSGKEAWTCSPNPQGKVFIHQGQFRSIRMRKVTGLGTRTPGFLGPEGCREGTPEQTGQLQDVVRDRVDLKPPSTLGSNSCGFLASKRLVTHAASFRLAAFEKQPGQRYWQRRLPCRLGLGKGAQRIPETQVSFCLNFSQAIRGPGEKVSGVGVSGGELWSTPAHPHTSAASHPDSDAPPPL